MDDSTVVALRLSKEGFGTPQQMLDMKSDLVLDALEYAGFLSDYHSTYVELNREKN